MTSVSALEPRRGLGVQESGQRMNTPTSTIIAGLMRPQSYPHPAPRIELAETHISWVLLAGEFAYKVKKPVDFGFVDFASLERRRRYCEEELRLNRRLAPQLYLGVVPVTGSPDAPRLGGNGPPIEWAVKMRRFRRDDELAAMATRGELRAEQVESLARRVAGFHARADARPPDPAWGSAAAVLEHWLGNFEAIARSGLAAAERARLDALRAWTLAQHARLAPMIDARRATGFVRECHGDLHLGNVVLLDGQPVPFDALEFDPALRWTDVVAEIAFTMMDLERHGRPELARHFLDTWLECTGDFAGLALLPAMLAYRAMVRAKVSALRAGQEQDAAQRTASLDAMRACIALAERFAAPRPRALAITTGVSGSGKSRLALALAEHGDWVRIRSDVERKRLAGLPAAERAVSEPGEGLYAPSRSDEVYRRLGALAREVLAAGFPALVDATCLERARRDALRAVADGCDAGFAILSVEAPVPLLRQRVLRRCAAGGDPSDATIAVLERQLAAREPLGEDERARAVAVDTSAPSDPRSISQALLALARRAAPPV
jgi:aminoglycoside phosphotransferase family enzyme/predicted kinase